MNTAFQYIMKAGGVLRGEDYPYTGIDGHCKFENLRPVKFTKIFNYIQNSEYENFPCILIFSFQKIRFVLEFG